MSTAFLTISGIPTSITVRSVQLHIRLDSLMNSGDYSGFPGGSDGKESACNVGDPGSIPGLGISPGGENGYPLQYSCLENPHGQRSLVGYSPRGCKKLDMTEQLPHLLLSIIKKNQ